MKEGIFIAGDIIMLVASATLLYNSINNARLHDAAITFKNQGRNNTPQLIGLNPNNIYQLNSALGMVASAGVGMYILAAISKATVGRATTPSIVTTIFGSVLVVCMIISGNIGIGTYEQIHTFKDEHKADKRQQASKATLIAGCITTIVFITFTVLMFKIPRKITPKINTVTPTNSQQLL